MRKYVIAALLIVNAGLLSTIYLVRKRASELTLESQPAAERKPVPRIPPAAERRAAGTDANPTVPNIFERERAGILIPESGGEVSGAPALFPASAGAKLRREGSKLTGITGTVRRRGNRFEFVPLDHSPPLLLLENQLLQRIDAVQDRDANPEALRWKANGLVTEYLGDNYLLLQWLVLEGP